MQLDDQWMSDDIMRVVRVTPKKMFDNFMQVRRWWPRLPARSATRIHCTTSCIDYKIGNILDTSERTGTEPKDAQQDRQDQGKCLFGCVSGTCDRFDIIRSHVTRC